LNARRSTIASGRDLYWFLTGAPPVLIRARPPVAVRQDRVVHPYRELPTDREAPSAPREELLLYVILCAVGAIPVAAALLRGGGFGVEATVGLAMSLAGLAGLVASARAARSRWKA
jgi:hypothetical protein